MQKLVVGAGKYIAKRDQDLA